MGADSEPGGAGTRECSPSTRLGQTFVILAELDVRHTRRHQPTRRVALGDAYLPTSGAAFGAVLLGAVVAEFVPEIDEEQLDALVRLVDDARRGISVPRIALRYRLQTDTHGLDLSRHHILAPDVEAGLVRPRLELDLHGPPTSQVIGALLGAASLPPSGRSIAFRAVDAALARPGFLPEGLEVRRRLDGLPGVRPPAPGVRCGGCRRVAGRPVGAALGHGGARLELRHGRGTRRRAAAVPPSGALGAPRSRRASTRARPSASPSSPTHARCSSGSLRLRVGQRGNFPDMASSPVHVTVTGAAGQIGYALVHRIASRLRCSAPTSPWCSASSRSSRR